MALLLKLITPSKMFCDKKVAVESTDNATVQSSIDYKHKISLLYHPFNTIFYSFKEIATILTTQDCITRPNSFKCIPRGALCYSCSIIIIVGCILLLLSGFIPTMIFTNLIKKSIYLLKWLILGILSSIGFGFGFHTFILYLAPFICSVTLAAWECESVNFPHPYPLKLICPDVSYRQTMSIWKIGYKIKTEALCWGFGSALGELLPYLVARSITPWEIQKTPFVSVSIQKTIQRLIRFLIQRVGFFGILICASIPNPLFDFAGLLCGLYNVSFSKFFGATLIGKSFIKVPITSLFLIICCSPSVEHAVINSSKQIPVIGVKISTILSNILSYFKAHYHPDYKPNSHSKFQIFQTIINLIMIATLLYFTASAITSLAKSYLKRHNKST